ncbi:hypothetical protein DFH09DRAFT_1288812 [Mycena vulgaris]|nr:hypothetical protein DFH09DRAFT_1288812 [Mycena vulgaris]
MVVRGRASGKRGKLTVKAESESRVPVFGRVVPKAEVTRVIRVLPPSCALQTSYNRDSVWVSPPPFESRRKDRQVVPHAPSSRSAPSGSASDFLSFDYYLLHTAAASWNTLLPSFVPGLVAAIIRTYLARASLNFSNGGTAPTPQDSMDPPKSKSMHRAQKKGLSSVGVRSSYVPIPWNLAVFERYCAAWLSYCDSDSDFRNHTVAFVHDSIHVLLSPSLQPCIRYSCRHEFNPSIAPTARTPRESLSINRTLLALPNLMLACPVLISGCVDSSTRRSPPDSRKCLEDATPQFLCPTCETVASVSPNIHSGLELPLAQWQSQNLNNERPYITGGHRNSLLDSNPLGHTLQANSSGVVYGTPRGFMSGKIDFTRKPGFDSPRPTYVGALHSFFEHPLLVSNSLGLDIRFS